MHCEIVTLRPAGLDKQHTWLCNQNKSAKVQWTHTVDLNMDLAYIYARLVYIRETT